MFQKFEIESEEIFFMKKMRYFGSQMQSQRIKAKKAPKIEMMKRKKEDVEQKDNENEQNNPKFVEFKVISEAGMKAKRIKGKIR
jgi:hypothetical protein